jgi:hypothetical protein
MNMINLNGGAQFHVKLPNEYGPDLILSMDKLANSPPVQAFTNVEPLNRGGCSHNSKHQVKNWTRELLESYHEMRALLARFH